ncbi:EAL domain-containing protein, partial [Paraburkholderia caledonica]|uniref:EAL domain-containing protein n=1 Tax=Paraburkholderia caledonica TaxID=134536 RepID=UPI00211B0C18
LTLYSPFPGGFTAADRIAFIALLQTILGFAIARIERLEGSTSTVPYAVRQHWSQLLRSDALQMHYQPLLDLRTGQVTKVEALARLRDGDRLLMPGEFFPALSSDNFLELYVRGLGQTLAQRNRWLQGGVNLTVSVNLPPSALSDIRYFEATRQALTEHGCAPHMLTLEIL